MSSTPPADSATRWLPVTLAAALATVLIIGGTAWLGQRDSSTPPGGTDEAPSSAPRRTVEVPVFFVGATAAGPRLFQETHRIEDTSDSDLQVAVQQALTGTPRDTDYAPWSAQHDLTVTATAGHRVITVDLSDFGDAHRDLVQAEARLRLQALVWTATTAISSELPVRFLVRGEPVERLMATDTTLPVPRNSADSVLSAVSIASPAEGEQVPSRFEVHGEAAAPEATVVWELRRGENVVRDGYATARECCTLSPYSFTVSAPPGDYTLVVQDTDDSDGEGLGTTEDTKNIVVVDERTR